MQPFFYNLQSHLRISPSSFPPVFSLNRILKIRLAFEVERVHLPVNPDYSYGGKVTPGALKADYTSHFLGKRYER